MGQEACCCPNGALFYTYPKYAGVRRVSCWPVVARAETVREPSESLLSQSYGSFSITLYVFMLFSNTDVRSWNTTR